MQAFFLVPCERLHAAVHMGLVNAHRASPGVLEMQQAKGRSFACSKCQCTWFCLSPASLPAGRRRSGPPVILSVGYFGFKAVLCNAEHTSLSAQPALSTFPFLLAPPFVPEIERRFLFCNGACLLQSLATTIEAWHVFSLCHIACMPATCLVASDAHS
jgi:hypothetical protein